MANSNNVSTGKPQFSGAVYVQLLSNAVPPTAANYGTAEVVPTGFASVGYISEEGVEISVETETQQIKAFGGDVVDESQTSYAEKFTFAMIERTEITQKVFWGENNAEDKGSSGGMTVATDSKDLPIKAWVLDFALKAGPMRIVIPRAKVTNREAISYKNGEVIAYKVTLSAFPDSSGKYHYEYSDY